MCAFDEVHDEYMYECFTLVMHLYAKHENGRGRRTDVCLSKFLRESCATAYIRVAVWSG